MKQAIVFGATGSIGQELVKILLEKGYKILGTSKTKSKDENIELVQLDFSNLEQVKKFCERLEKLDIDFITNTIGSYTMNKFEKIPFENFQKDLELNFLNYAYVLQRIIPKMKKNSNIIFILTEMVVGDPNYFLSSYVSSKYALLGLMKSLAGELKQRKIRVNAISPGMMDTKFSEKVPSIIKEQYIKASPIKRLVEPKEVGVALKKILEENITGENILILGKKL